MSNELQPLLFRHVYKDYVWGGDRIISTYHRDEPPGVYAESWEVSTRPEGMSVVSNGALAGEPLDELSARFGKDLLGTHASSTEFPLLIKLLDAKKRLSVQVHPNDKSAAMHGGEAKTEMWYVLDADEGAVVYAGLKDGVDAEQFRKSIEEQSVEELIDAIPVEKGDAIYIPGGLVHAIGSGCLLLEIQQNSNTTYRIYDWGRMGSDGKPRELHVEDALKVIQWKQDQSPKLKPPEPLFCAGNAHWELMVSPYFRLERIIITEPLSVRHDAESFHLLFVADGHTRLTWSGGELALDRGTSCLLPACLTEYGIDPADESAEILRVTLP